MGTNENGLCLNLNLVMFLSLENQLEYSKLYIDLLHANYKIKILILIFQPFFIPGP